MTKDQAIGFIQLMIRDGGMRAALITHVGLFDFPEIHSTMSNISPPYIKRPAPVANLLRQIADALDPPEDKQKEASG